MEEAGMRLDYAAFRMSPTKSRCELLIAAEGHELEVLASASVDAFSAHIKAFGDGEAVGNVIRLQPTSGDDWFTKATLERFVKLVNDPEVIERALAIEEELRQHSEVDTPEQNVAMTSSALSEEKTSSDADANAALRSHSRFSLLQMEQSMAIARAEAYGFTIERIVNLKHFADKFGTAALRSTCEEYINLCSKRSSMEQLSGHAEAGTHSDDSGCSPTSSAVHGKDSGLDSGVGFIIEEISNTSDRRLSVQEKISLFEKTMGTGGHDGVRRSMDRSMTQKPVLRRWSLAYESIMARDKLDEESSVTCINEEDKNASLPSPPKLRQEEGAEKSPRVLQPMDAEPRRSSSPTSTLEHSLDEECHDIPDERHDAGAVQEVREAEPDAEEALKELREAEPEASDKRLDEADYVIPSMQEPPAFSPSKLNIQVLQSVSMDNQQQEDDRRSVVSDTQSLKDKKGRLYEKYREKRDAKLRDQTGPLKAEKQAKLRKMQEYLERRRSEISKASSRVDPLVEAQARAAKLRAFKAGLLELKKEKEEEERKRLEALRLQRQRRPAQSPRSPHPGATSASSTAKLGTTTAAKSTLPKSTTLLPTFQKSSSLNSRNAQKPGGSKSQRNGNGVVQSVPSLDELQKLGAKPPAAKQDAGKVKKLTTSASLRRSVPGLNLSRHLVSDAEEDISLSKSARLATSGTGSDSRFTAGGLAAEVSIRVRVTTEDDEPAAPVPIAPVME